MPHTQTHRALEIRSKQEINDLKSEWESNPNWDLWASPGFEAHEQELREHQIKKEIEWSKAKDRRIRMAATSMGLTTDLYKKWRHYKNLSEVHRNEAHKMMLNLVFGTTKVDKHLEVEVESLLDSIFRGAINIAKAEMIQDIQL